MMKKVVDVKKVANVVKAKDNSLQNADYDSIDVA